MYAITEIAGQQFKVEKGTRIFVHLLDKKIGEEIEFNKVLLMQSGKTVRVGSPTLKGVKINAKVISHVKGGKVKVFKKKRRKGYKKLNGHRQQFSLIEITSL